MIDLIIFFCVVISIFWAVTYLTIIYLILKYEFIIWNDISKWTFLDVKLCEKDPTFKIITIGIGYHVKQFRGVELFWEDANYRTICSPKLSANLREFYKKHCR